MKTAEQPSNQTRTIAGLATVRVNDSSQSKNRASERICAIDEACVPLVSAIRASMHKQSLWRYKIESRQFSTLATTVLIALIALLAAWEWLLAPLRPGGSWLLLKVIPLAMALPGAIQGRRYTFQWSSMLVLAYLAEGLVRAFSDIDAASRVIALAESVLSACYFVLAIAYVRLHGTQ